MTTVIIHTGKKGEARRDGVTGYGVSDVRKSLIAGAVTDVFRANNLSDEVTWSRGGEAAFITRYGEWEKESGKNVTHLLANSDDFDDDGAQLTHEWQYEASVLTRDTDRVEADPLGGTQASQLTFSGSVGNGFGLMGNMLAGKGIVTRVSIYIKVISGTLNKVSFKNGSGGVAVDFPQTPSSDWQRFDTVYTSTGSGEARFLFDCPSGCVVHVFRANMTQGTKLYEPLLIGDNRPVIYATDAEIPRQNESGYLIEGAKTNLCTYSQDLSQWDSTGAPTISANPNPDPFGDSNTVTLVSFSANQLITLSQSISVTSGEQYAVSFWAVSVSGEVESMSLSLGGSDAQLIELTDDYTRQELIFTAGSSGIIEFSVTASTAETSFILHGVQVELGDSSSYIATASRVATREADAVSLSSLPLSFADDYTIQLCYRGITFADNSVSYAFNTDDGLSIRFDLSNEQNRALFNGVSLFDESIDRNGEIIITWSNGTAAVYYNGALANTVAISAVDGEQTGITIGASDNAQSDALNGFIKRLRFWDFAMTAAEVAYISEVDVTNRFGDRG